MSPRSSAWKATWSRCRTCSSTRSRAKTLRAASSAATSSRACARPSGTRPSISAGSASWPTSWEKKLIENLANLDPMIMGAVGILVLALITVSVALLNSLYGPRARLERRLTSVGGNPISGREKGSVQAKTQSGMRRKDIEAKLKAAEQIKRQQRGYKLQEKLIQAGVKTTPKQFWIYSLACGAVFALIVYGAS